VPVIDTDVIAREVVEPGQPALARVVETFGPEVLGSDGRLDRRRLRERIFTDPDARHRLEAILHPAIRAEMERQSRAADGPYQVPVIPRVLVVGAGIAGLEAALRLADAGVPVVLVEREPVLGGHMAMIDRTFPTLD
jgi:dephospho-CoA kinase